MAWFRRRHAKAPSHADSPIRVREAGGELVEFRELCGAWIARDLDGDDVVTGAAEMVARGWTGDRLVALAALYPSVGSSELEMHLERAWSEFAWPLPSGEAVTELALRRRCRLLRRGEETLRDLLGWAGHRAQSSEHPALLDLAHVGWDLEVSAATGGPTESDESRFEANAVCRRLLAQPCP